MTADEGAAPAHGAKERRFTRRSLAAALSAPLISLATPHSWPNVLLLQCQRV
jgi:hypothetical protein